MKMNQISQIVYQDRKLDPRKVIISKFEFVYSPILYKLLKLRAFLGRRVPRFYLIMPQHIVSTKIWKVTGLNNISSLKLEVSNLKANLLALTSNAILQQGFTTHVCRNINILHIHGLPLYEEYTGKGIIQKNETQRSINFRKLFVKMIHLKTVGIVFSNEDIFENDITILWKTLSLIVNLEELHLKFQKCLFYSKLGPFDQVVNIHKLKILMLNFLACKKPNQLSTSSPNFFCLSYNMKSLEKFYLQSKDCILGKADFKEVLRDLICLRELVLSFENDPYLKEDDMLYIAECIKNYKHLNLLHINIKNTTLNLDFKQFKDYLESKRIKYKFEF